MKRVSGGHIGKKAKPHWVCTHCGFIGLKKYDHPKECNHLPLYMASKAELKFFNELRLKQRAGLVQDIRTQVAYDLIAHGGEKIGKYIIDFVYFDLELGDTVFVDIKGGAITDLSKWKIKHFELQYGCEVEIVKR